jgi:N-acetylneuraminic acid mutarotase
MKVVKKLAPFPYQLADMAVVRHDGKLIILGGYKKHGGISNDVLVYDVTTQQCSKLPSSCKRGETLM